MKRNIIYNYNSKVRSFFLVQITMFFLSFAIYYLINNAIIGFCSLLVLFTIASLFVFEILFDFIYILIKSTIFKDRVSCLVKILLLGGCLALSINYTSKYYKDIPYVIKGEYSVIVGECTHCYAYRGKAAHLDVTVDGIEFDVSLGYKDSIKKGEIYKIVYLPNTKDVLEIYGVKNTN